MRLIGNLIWFTFGGFLSGLGWMLSGILWCLSIVGIPFGRQCFKFASLAFSPFGKNVVYGGGTPSFLCNLIWLIFFGIEMAVVNAAVGFLWCVTIVGIPFGKQFFKLARLSLMPFGAMVV
ncbi:MAG: YccF domain-containing protein [Clostridia bacterium]|nr:YccF domain-containing protein [Clostridia bacterium]